MGERYLIPTLYTRVSVRLTTPTQKSVSIDTSGDGVNLPDCTDLCNRFKIALVLDALKIECISITTLCPVRLIALSQNCDARRLPGCVNPLLDAPTCEDVPTFGDMPSQIPPDVAALHRLRFSLRGMPVQMRGKQAFGVWQYTFITGQRKSAEPAKTRLCAGVICCLVLGAGLDVQQLHNSGIIALVLFKLLAQCFNLRLAAL